LWISTLCAVGASTDLSAQRRQTATPPDRFIDVSVVGCLTKGATRYALSQARPVGTAAGDEQASAPATYTLVEVDATQALKVGLGLDWTPPDLSSHVGHRVEVSGWKGTPTWKPDLRSFSDRESGRYVPDTPADIVAETERMAKSIKEGYLTLTGLKMVSAECK